VLNKEGEKPIEIGRLQRYAVDYVLDNNIHLFKAGKPNGRRVACIGAGPASLACAAELAKWGYAVLIYDRNPVAGGLNTYGIAAYKTRAADSLREVKLVEELGVKIRSSVAVGKDVSLGELEDQFNAVFIGVGLGETWSLNLPGENLKGVCGAMEFIQRTKAEPFENVDVGRRVAVIGAGNTAIDVVTAARRLGAEFVYLLYRRSEREMPAFKYEYELAKKDGVIFYWQTQPVRIIGQDGLDADAAIALTIAVRPHCSIFRPKRSRANHGVTSTSDAIAQSINRAERWRGRSEDRGWRIEACEVNREVVS
jgi:glutamate synthase (NADPH/NADH) small chain